MTSALTLVWMTGPSERLGANGLPGRATARVTDLAGPGAPELSSSVESSGAGVSDPAAYNTNETPSSSHTAATVSQRSVVRFRCRIRPGVDEVAGGDRELDRATVGEDVCHLSRGERQPGSPNAAGHAASSMRAWFRCQFAALRAGRVR